MHAREYVALVRLLFYSTARYNINVCSYFWKKSYHKLLLIFPTGHNQESHTTSKHCTEQHSCLDLKIYT